MVKNGTLASPAMARASKRLAGSRGTDHEDTFRDLAAKFLELAGILQEIDDFDDFLLCLFDPRDIGEGDIDLIFAQEPCAALAEGHGAAATGRALHLAHEVRPETDEDQDREGRDQQLEKNRLLFRRFAAEFDLLRLQQADQSAVARLRIVGDELITVACACPR